MALEITRQGASGGMDCETWAALLADRLDGEMPVEQEALWAAHAASCAGCGLLLEEAENGREWLGLLKEEAPQPPIELLGKILEQTGAAGRGQDYPLGAFAAHAGTGRRWPVPAHLHVPGHRDARLLLTAAMAFFSVALTLSMVGVRLNQVHAAELKPEAVQANVTRSFYGTKKQLVSFYENLRFVYEVEARMRAMHKDTPGQSEPAAPAQRPAAPANKGRGGHASAVPHSAGGTEWRGAPAVAWEWNGNSTPDGEGSGL